MSSLGERPAPTPRQLGMALQVIAENPHATVRELAPKIITAWGESGPGAPSVKHAVRILAKSGRIQKVPPRQSWQQPGWVISEDEALRAVDRERRRQQRIDRNTPTPEAL